MRCKVLVGYLLASLFVLRAGAATTAFYVNDALLLCPPQIPPQVDATNFVNNNYFSISFTNFPVLPMYNFSNTRNFTNNGVMIGNKGFVMDWFDTLPVVDVHKPAANIVNNGTISVGSGFNTNLFFSTTDLLQVNLPKLHMATTNIVLRSSTNIVGVDGLFTITGKNVDLNRAYVAMEGFDDTLDSLLFTTFDTVGLNAGYWGAGTNLMNPVTEFELPPPTSPFSLVTFPGGVPGFQRLVVPGAQFFEDEFIVDTNRFVQAVFVSNTNSSILNNVYFPFNGVKVVEWIGLVTNQANGVVTTNRLYLTDDFGTFFTNTVVANFSYYSAAGTAQPINYSFTRFNPFPGFLGGAFPPSSPAGVFDPGVVTNQFAAFQALMTPTTVSISNLPPSAQYLTNLPGRIQITAENLDLTYSRIVGLNYLDLKATNHVLNTAGANITVPFSDINLATTNGHLAVTNLLYPTVQRFTGSIDLWSGRWTNDAFGFRNIYSVLVVDSRMSPTAPAQIQDLTLKSTNIVISDVLNVTRNLLIEAERITLTSNTPPAATTNGQLNLLSSAITWPTSTPRLKYLTNNGAISSLNAVFFGGSRFSPYFTSNYNEPYVAFVNRGGVTTQGSLIWADYFENSGQFSTGTGFGSIALQSLDARLTNGTFMAVNGDISIATASLSISNHLLQAGRKLTLAVTNLLVDTGTSNANSWAVGRGFDLPVKPAVGDLLGATITDTAAPSVENTHLIAGEDRGASVAGFANNLAVGHLILDGQGPISAFSFNGVGSANALYVDLLDLRNYATNFDMSGNLSELIIAPNATIYYGQAVAGNISVAERINGANGGRLVWVSDYAGIYSGTNVVYPDGTTNRINSAVVGSQNEDSDCDGLANAADPSPRLLITTTSLPVATNGLGYSAFLQNGGGVAPFTWSVASGALPGGMNLLPNGLISGTPTNTGTFLFRARVSQVACGVAAEQNFTLNVQPGPIVLSMAIVHHSPPGAEITWQTKPNHQNYVYYRNSLVTGDWQLLTNFVSATVANVSVWDPVGTNQSRYYRVRVQSP